MQGAGGLGWPLERVDSHNPTGRHGLTRGANWHLCGGSGWPACTAPCWLCCSSDRPRAFSQEFLIHTHAALSFCIHRLGSGWAEVLTGCGGVHLWLCPRLDWVTWEVPSSPVP